MLLPYRQEYADDPRRWLGPRNFLRIRGAVRTKNGRPIGDVTIHVQGGIVDGYATTYGTSSGNYRYPGEYEVYVPPGEYTITVSRDGWTFTPSTVQVTVKNQDVTQNFVGQQTKR